MSDITHILFDLGGVLVALRGRPIDDAWLDDKLTPEESWKLWLTSKAPKDFESGRIDEATFAARIVEELNLGVTPEAFLARFVELPVGLYDGALELLHTLKRRYRTGIFSNSNTLHWPKKMNEMRLDTAVHDHFASHLMGHVKPDQAGFHHVIDAWAVAPAHVLFLDDNRLNVEAAGVAGLQARHVQGFDAVVQALHEAGIDCDDDQPA